MNPNQTPIPITDAYGEPPTPKAPIDHGRLEITTQIDVEAAAKRKKADALAHAKRPDIAEHRRKHQEHVDAERAARVAQYERSIERLSDLLAPVLGLEGSAGATPAMRHGAVMALLELAERGAQQAEQHDLHLQQTEAKIPLLNMPCREPFPGALMIEYSPLYEGSTWVLVSDGMRFELEAGVNYVPADITDLHSLDGLIAKGRIKITVPTGTPEEQAQRILDAEIEWAAKKETH